MLTKQEVGRQGEDEAISFFLGEGFTLVDRNWFCRFGEIDVIVEKAQTLHFVEVKARFTDFEHPFEAISEQKRLRLSRAIGLWREGHPQWGRHPYQVDAFCLWQEQGKIKTEWIQGM